MSPAEPGGRSGAPPLVLALVLALWLAALVMVHVKVAQPDAIKYRQLITERSAAGGGGNILSVPPSLDRVLQANRIPAGLGEAGASTAFLESMSQRASRARLRLEAITPGVTVVNPAVMRVSAELHMTGSYANLDRLLRDLARSPELIAVDYLHVTKDEQHERGLLIELRTSRIWVNPEVTP